MFRVTTNRNDNHSVDFFGYDNPSVGALFYQKSIGFAFSENYSFSPTLNMDVRVSDSSFVRAQGPNEAGQAFTLTSAGFPVVPAECARTLAAQLPQLRHPRLHFPRRSRTAVQEHRNPQRRSHLLQDARRPPDQVRRRVPGQSGKPRRRLTHQLEYAAGLQRHHRLHRGTAEQRGRGAHRTGARLVPLWNRRRQHHRALHRRLRRDRQEHRRLRAGRLEGHPQTEYQLRTALRIPDRAHRALQPLRPRLRPHCRHALRRAGAGRTMR